jgi:hypothetical protein
MIAALKPHHRVAFTGLAYQYFAICGEGSDDPGGSNDCTAAEAVGAPHLSRGHPIPVARDLGAQLAAAMPGVELWPVISYGNPGNASVLNRLLLSRAAKKQFIADAIQIGHRQNLTGFNFDLETSGVDHAALQIFVGEFVSAMHAANPRLGVSFDAGNTPLSKAIAMDRWISMATYTSSLPSFLAGLSQGMQASGSQFGVGLCPICSPLSAAAVRARFDAIASYGERVHEIDLWAANYGSATDKLGVDWAPYWPLLARWLAGNTTTAASGY